MAGENTGTDEGKGSDGAGAEETPPEPTVFDKYRARLDAGETGVFEQPQEEGGDAEEEPEEGEAAGEEEGGEAGAGEEEEEGEGGEEEGEGAEEGEEDEGGEAGGEAKEGAEEGEAGGEGDDSLSVKLPGRNAGEEVEFEVEDVNARDALNRLRKGYMRGEEARNQLATVQADRDEIEEIDALMATDPAGFLLEHVSKENRIQVARALLLNDDVYEALTEELDGISDETAREHARLKSEAERRETSDKAKKTLASNRAAKKAVTAIHDNIMKLVPEGTPLKVSATFQKMALSTAEETCNRLKRLDITEDELVASLTEAGLLDFVKKSGAPPTRQKKTGKAGTDEPGGAPPKAAALKKAKLRRKNVAGSSPAGVGSPPAAVELPKNQSVKERIAHVRSKGIGNVLRGKRGG